MMDPVRERFLIVFLTYLIGEVKPIYSADYFAVLTVPCKKLSLRTKGPEKVIALECFFR